MRIGVLGGTGPAGKALAARLASVGFDVVIGSRSLERASEAAEDLVESWPGHRFALEGGENATAAAADVVVVATPWDAAASTAASVADQLGGKVLISMANALQRVGGEFQPLVGPRGSIAAAVQAAVPDAGVAAAFQHVPAKELGEIDHPIESDVLVCSDHPWAKDVAIDIVGKLPNLRPLDAGELSNAAAIEAFVAVLLQLNVRYSTRAAVKLLGIDT